MTKLSPVTEKGHRNCVATEFNPILWGNLNQTVLYIITDRNYKPESLTMFKLYQYNHF